MIAVPVNEEGSAKGTTDNAPPPPSLDDKPIGETSKSRLNDHEGGAIEELDRIAAEEDLSLFVKLCIAAVILALCYAFVRAYSPRGRSTVAGRHGAYEKTGIA
jgi:hypothetical protein